MIPVRLGATEVSLVAVKAAICCFVAIITFTQMPFSYSMALNDGGGSRKNQKSKWRQTKKEEVRFVIITLYYYNLGLKTHLVAYFLEVLRQEDLSARDSIWDIPHEYIRTNAGVTRVAACHDCRPSWRTL
jgi:hypothetical protein